MTASPITGAPLDLRSRFLEQLPAEDLRVILGAATQRHLCAHSIVTNQGDTARYFFLLRKGRGRFFYTTEGGQRLLLHWFAPGEIFGVMSLLPNPSTYLISTEIVKDSLVLVWDRATMQDLVLRYPRLAMNALSTAAEYLTLCIATHVTLTCHNARERLAEVLINLTRTIGQEVKDGIELDVTNEELAIAANITPFTTSRLLNEWRRNGAVVKTRGKILLRFPQRLFSRAA